ncbi:MAG: glycosyltransferase [Gammaproteobacteria bacterium]|jgi:GT2 family glycosyltransferase|nr:glycosyltransferase [Gammaproteobacteria bacterium]
MVLNLNQAKVTIVIPHYKTLELTKLCLRLLRKHTDINQAEILVIDNGSQDASTDYLKTLSWINLLIRDTTLDPTPWESHGNALNEAIAQVNTPYMLVIHTDTLVKKQGWLDFLLRHIEGHPLVAGVGSWKLESKPWYKRLFKKIERYFHLFLGLFGNKKKNKLYGTSENPYYLRSHCALYRTDLLKEHRLSFIHKDSTAGRELHRRLVELGYEMVFIPSEGLSIYMDHVNHATMVLNPDENELKSAAVKKGLKRIRKALKAVKADLILASDDLDH